MSGVNFFTKVTDPDYDFSFLQVYVNDKLTNIPANALTAAAGDDIRIVSLSKPYPFFYPNSKDYIASIEEPLPFMGETDFSSCFYYCTSLTSIPEGLFDNNPNVTDFSRCFNDCENLTVRVQIGSTTTSSVYVSFFAYGTAAKGTVYCRAGSNAYTTFLNTPSVNVNVLTY